ncbi:MAG: hypothetical protein AAF529_05975 [Pseudomonadota bacterium]
MEILIVLFAALLSICFIVWVIRASRQQSRERQDLIRDVQQRGWRFQDECIRVLPTQVAMLKLPMLQHSGIGDFIREQFTGQYQEHECLVFTHRPEYERRLRMEVADRTYLMLRRPRNAQTVPAFQLNRGHRVTDAFISLAAAGIAGDETQRTSPLQPIDLPPVLDQWRIFGDQATAQWLALRGYQEVNRDLEQAELDTNSVFWVVGEWVIVSLQRLNIDAFNECLAKAKWFSDWLDE